MIRQTGNLQKKKVKSKVDSFSKYTMLFQNLLSNDANSKKMYIENSLCVKSAYYFKVSFIYIEFVLR